MPELAEDIARRVAQNEVRLVPAVGQTGYYLGVTGQSPFSYAFLQPPDDEIPRFPGSPDGVRGAPIDSLVRNTDDHTVWINTDGDTAWEQVGSAGGGFPVTRDDGTNTYSLDAGAPGWGTGQFAMHQELDADPTVYADVLSFVDTDYAEVSIDAQAEGEGKAFVNAGDDYASAYLRANTSSGTPARVELEADTGNTPETSAVVFAGKVDISATVADLTLAAAGDISIQPTGAIFVLNLPTSDPGNPGQLYTSAGALMVSP